MIDPMATGTVKRPAADLDRPRGREALSTHPPAPVDDTPRGASNIRWRTRPAVTASLMYCLLEDRAHRA